MADITCKAAVAMGVNDLQTKEIIVSPPRAGEVRLRVLYNALCHTDCYTLEGSDPEGLFPSILGHEATAVVHDVGEGVTSVKAGDIVVPCYTPQCNEAACCFCMSAESNLCPAIREFTGKGVMRDGTTRFRFADSDEPIFHFMGCSTFAEYTVLHEISVAKITAAAEGDAALQEKAALMGCGVSTGYGAVFNTTKVQRGRSVAVFGLGAVGLAVVQAAKMAGATKVIGIDISGQKEARARAMGCTDFFNPSRLPNGAATVGAAIMADPVCKWGVDYTFDCTGNTEVMRQALELAHRGWGKSCVIGVAAAGKEISTRPFQLITGRQWMGTAFGGWKSRSAVPKLVDEIKAGSLDVSHFITHRFTGVGQYSKAIEALHSGDCLRAVIKY